MTSSGDVAQVTPKVGQKIDKKLKTKKEKFIMTSFRSFVKGQKVNESPVGQKGRTGVADAVVHIEGTGLEKEFQAIVKKLGGKTVARELLARMNTKADTISPEGDKTLNDVELGEAKKQSENPVEYLRDGGFKIKSEEPTERGIEIEFFKEDVAREAKEDLESAGFSKKYSLNVVSKFLEIIEL